MAHGLSCAAGVRGGAAEVASAYQSDIVYKLQICVYVCDTPAPPLLQGTSLTRPHHPPSPPPSLQVCDRYPSPPTSLCPPPLPPSVPAGTSPTCSPTTCWTPTSAAEGAVGAGGWEEGSPGISPRRMMMRRRGMTPMAMRRRASGSTISCAARMGAVRQGGSGQAGGTGLPMAKRAHKSTHRL